MRLKRNIFLLFIFFCVRLTAFAQDSLVLGEFTISKIIDGDTFRFEKLDKSTRMLGIDTEEMYKGKDAEAKTNSLRQNWRAIYDSARGKEKKPIKHNSPLGYETWLWAKEIFKDAVRVRLEKESNDRFIDTYGRYLVYVIGIREDSSEFNYNVECVKNGYSPYFMKYGYSKRFHNEFVEAQKYAREHRLGIWSGEKLCYPDYKERLEWWARRAKAIAMFEKNYKGKPECFSIMDDKDFHDLKNHEGEEVTVFGSISEIYKDKEPHLIRFSFSNTEHFVLTVFPEHVKLMEEMEIEDLIGEFVYVKGKLKSYQGKVEIDFTDKKQIWRE